MPHEPRAQAAGLAGYLGGLGLSGEFVLFTVSGGRPNTVQHATTALPDGRPARIAGPVRG